MQLRRLLPLTAPVAFPAVSWARAGESSLTADVPLTWSVAPEVALPLLAMVLLYRRGVRRRAQAARLVSSEPEPYCFAAGMLVVAIALLSPLDALAADLASAHMLRHMLLIAVAPALLAQGAPMRTPFWGLPAPNQKAGRSSAPRLEPGPVDCSPDRSSPSSSGPGTRRHLTRRRWPTTGCTRWITCACSAPACSSGTPS